MDSVIARIYYPNGSSAENYTMVSGGGSIYWNNSYVVYFTPAGTYNVTIFANDTNGVSNTETTWFAPYLNLSKEENITINGSFEDWSGVTVVTDNGTDASGGAGVVDNELLITGLNDDGGNISIFAFNQSGTEEYDLNWSADTGSDGPSQVSGGKIGDVTNDGNNDFLIPSSDGSNYYLEVWTYNSSSQEWYNVWTSAAISSSYRPWIGAIGDFDDDTFTEFLITKQNSDIEIWGNDSYNATGFSLNTTLKSGCSTGNYPEGAGDLNDNDIPELVVQCITTDPFEIYEWNTTDYELQDSVSRDGLFADEIECGDLDRDTIDECVICGGNGNTTVIDYSGGSYSKVYWNDAPDATPSCGIGDFTNDGWPDFFDVNQVDGVRVFSYNGTDYVNIWNGTGGFGGDPLIAASDGGDADNDGRDEIIHPTEEAGDTIMLWENNSDSEAESFNNTLNWTGIGNIVNIIIGDLDSDAIGLEGGSNEDFDITNMSLANNDTYLFARIAVNGSIDVSEGDKYYRVFISTDDSVGNETSPENEDLPFKYDFRVQVNGSSCYVFNYTDYSINVSSCLFNYTGGQMEIAVNLTVLGLSTNDNANITFQTGSTNPGGYDSAPDGESFLSYDVPGGPPAISITAEGSFTGSATINENESTNYTGNCTCSGGSCDDVYIRIQDNSTGGWSDSSTTGDNVFVNVTSYSIPSPLSGTSDNYYFNVTGNSSGHYNFRVVCNTTSATEDPSDASLLVVSACNVDFTMTSQLQTGILFSEQDPNVVNVSAADNGDYNVTDNSNSACGTVNVSVRATSDLVNGSSTIGIDNVTVNSTSPGSQTIQLSTSYQLIRSGMPAGTSNITTLYFWLTIPGGQDPKDYNTTIYIMEEME
ncbi:MAG: VCBS repeat-containing protein [Candidatus Aenigmatarchaeota archaeon]|nr:MAG: VCBS repeat-containing protein [Candidatus Aenigmarchaeota archaeon]